MRHLLSKAACVGGLLLSVVKAEAQTVYLQDSTIVGAGKTLTINRVPVVNNGQTTYQDLPITLAVGANGLLAISGKPVATISPSLDAGNFVAGTYQGSTGGDANLTALNGPGVTSGGATEWSLSLTSNGVCNDASTLCSATFYVGPVTSNPLYNRIKAAKITNTTAYSFGLSGGGNFGNGNLLGFAQTGNSFTVVDFSDTSGDHSTPQNQFTYTLTTH